MIHRVHFICLKINKNFDPKNALIVIEKALLLKNKKKNYEG